MKPTRKKFKSLLARFGRASLFRRIGNNGGFMYI
jgi:hypothetical protein